jgi:16S rRNA (guanine527-N7)-methyltransferase
MSPTATSSSAPTDPRLERWLERLLETPGLTAIRDPADARRVHLEEGLAAVPFVERYPGTVVDVGSGGGAPGIPIAAALPGREVVLLEANARKCEFLESVARDFPNVRVVRGRAEEQGTDVLGVAVAKALASPPVALEWCLPLVVPGGAAVLLVGPTAEPEAVARASAQLGGGPPEAHPGIFVVPKVAPTPEGFPRRPGIARKRPLA